LHLRGLPGAILYIIVTSNFMSYLHLYVYIYLLTHFNWTPSYKLNTFLNSRNAWARKETNNQHTRCILYIVSYYKSIYRVNHNFHTSSVIRRDDGTIKRPCKIVSFELWRHWKLLGAKNDSSSKYLIICYVYIQSWRRPIQS